MNEMVVSSISTMSGIVLLAYGLLQGWHVDRRLRQRGFLIATGGSGIMLVTSLLLGSTAIAAIHAAGIALWLWCWWNNGGGDGLRRLGRKLCNSLTGTTPAPQAT